MGWLMLLLQCFVISVQGCEYLYSEQPPPAIGCNPYEINELKLECTAHGPASVEFELVWFRLQLTLSDSTSDGISTALPELIRSGNVVYQMREQETRKIIRSQLRLQLQRDATASAFWCAMTVAGETPVSLLPSDIFILHDNETYSNLSSCNDTAQSSMREKCALSVPNTLTTTSPEPTPSTPSVHPSSFTSQDVLQPSLLLVPTTSMPADSPPPEGGKIDVDTIVIPLLACLAGALTTFCVTSCVYFHCSYCTRKKTLRKRFAVADPTNHTYSIPNSISFQSKGIPQGSGSATLPLPASCPSSPTHSQVHRTKSFNSQYISTWSNDQYVDMITSTNPEICQAVASSSYPTLNRTGLPLSDSENAGEGKHYEQSLSTLEPDYDTIPSASTPYLIMSGRLDQGSHIQRQNSLCSYDGIYSVPCHNPPLSPHYCAPSSCHDYDEVIQTIVNSAYLEAAVPTDHTLEQSVVGGPAQSQSPSRLLARQT